MSQYEAKLDELRIQSSYEDQLANYQRLEGKLQAMTDLKNEWEQKRKQEFSSCRALRVNSSSINDQTRCTHLHGH